MKSLLAVVAGVLTALVVILPAQSAGTGIDQAIAALKKGDKVYVDPGTEGTNSETAGVLASQLQRGDNIVLVMLPASELRRHDGDIGVLAAKVNMATGSKSIIGLSAGEEVVAYSALLPAGTAVDLMRRASSVSANTVETLQTYARNVHDWQSLHPDDPGSKPAEDEGRGFWVWLLLTLLLFAAIAVGAWIFRRATQQYDGGTVRLKKSPSVVRERLEAILETRGRIHDPDMKMLLPQICNDTEAYFARAERSGGISISEKEAMERNLNSLQDVLERYVDIQDNPRYYDDPEALMRSGLRAVSGFAAAVVNSIKRGNRRLLTNFNVDTDILDAQRYG